jgi:Leucine-rich repeat (LRR) protein
MKPYLLPLLILSLFLTGCTVSEQQAFNDASQKATADNKLVTSEQGSATTEQQPALKKLDLSNQKLTKVPNSVFNQMDLQELDISNNQITGAIQSQIGQLKNLKVLRASNNQMTGVPAEVGQLQNLQILDLSNNQLTGLPNELANLKNLKTLNLSGNNYSAQDLEVIMRGLPIGTKIIR